MDDDLLTALSDATASGAIPSPNDLARVDDGVFRCLACISRRLLITSNKPPFCLYLLADEAGVPSPPSFDTWLALVEEGRAERLIARSGTSDDAAVRLNVVCDMRDAEAFRTGANRSRTGCTVAGAEISGSNTEVRTTPIPAGASAASGAAKSMPEEAGTRAAYRHPQDGGDAARPCWMRDYDMIDDDLHDGAVIVSDGRQRVLRRRMIRGQLASEGTLIDMPLGQDPEEPVSAQKIDMTVLKSAILKGQMYIEPGTLVPSGETKVARPSLDELKRTGAFVSAADLRIRRERAAAAGDRPPTS